MEEERKKRVDLSLQEKRKILERFDKLPKMSQRQAAVHLKISQPLLCKILRNRENIENSHFSNQNMNRKRNRSGKDNQVETALKIWFRNVRKKNAPVNGPIIRQKAEELAKILGKEHFTATDGWFNRWKRRENIVYDELRVEEKSTDFVAASQWIKTEVVDETTLNNVNDCDEKVEDEDAEPPPTDAEMEAALKILRRGVQHRTSNFTKQYEYEDYIQNLINSNTRQTT